MAEGPVIAAVVGLGNPGGEYAATRHNVGFWLVDALAAAHGGQFKSERRFQGEVARVSVDGHDLRVLKPETYMNRSGQSVATLARFFKFRPDQLLVVHDDVDLPPGTVRVKNDGGHGGHNGLRDVIERLGTRDFRRLRIGVGHPGSAERVVGYVLAKPTSDERAAIEGAIHDALDALPLMLDGELDKATQRLHTAHD